MVLLITAWQWFFEKFSWNQTGFDHLLPESTLNDKKGFDFFEVPVYHKG